MNDALDDLLRRLDEAGPDGWENEYARFPVQVTRDEAHPIVNSRRAYADWLAFRFDAGPPGVPLPPFDLALKAILDGPSTGTALDAYQVVFSGRPLPESMKVEEKITVLWAAVACALKGGPWFRYWLASRAGLALIATGSPERAWKALDLLTTNGYRHPLLKRLELFEPIRGHPALERNPWVQAEICRLWPGLEVPLIPSLPFPDLAGEGVPTLEHTLEELARIGAHRVRELVQSFAEAWYQGAVEAHARDPLVRELRRLAMTPGSPPPEVEQLPPWLEPWALAAARTGELNVARLAGLLLHRAGKTDRKLTAFLVFRAARAADLSMLMDGLDDPEIQLRLQELTAAAKVLPPAVADALVAHVMHGPVDAGHALPVLEEHLDLLTSLTLTPGGPLARIISELRPLTQWTRNQAQEHDAARPAYEALLEQVKRAAHHLVEAGTPSPADVERAAKAIQVPPISAALLGLVEAEDSLESLPRLLQALAVRRAVEGTEHARIWRWVLTRIASDSIGTSSDLLALRLSLLDELIGAPPSGTSVAGLRYQRANTRRALFPDDPDETSLVLVDLHAAIRLGYAEGAPKLCAHAVAMWAKVLVMAESIDDRPRQLAEAAAAVDEALQLPLPELFQALLLQARARLESWTNPAGAAAALEQAMALLPVDGPLWPELASELVEVLLRSSGAKVATERGLSFLDQLSCRTEQIDLGMVYVAAGEALLAAGRLKEARAQLETGLRLVRGRDPHVEAQARTQLVQLGLSTGDRALTEEHLRFVRDREQELTVPALRLIRRLEAAAARAWGTPEGTRAALQGALSISSDASDRAPLLLEIALLDLAAARPGPGPADQLDRHVADAIEHAPRAGLDSLIHDAVRLHGARLSAPTREAVMRWAEQQHHPSLASSLHELAGDLDGARAALRRALEGALSDDERLRCASHLLRLLDGGARRQERRRLCDEIERLLEQAGDAPSIRLNLATALHMDADLDPQALARAWRHGKRGLEGARDPRTLEHGHRTLARIAVDVLRGVPVVSIEAAAEHATWFLGEHPLPAQELSEWRLRAADALLAPGLLVHPRALEVARQLLELARNAPEPAAGAEALAERLSWIERGQETPETAAPESPSWLVSLVAGHEAKVTAAELEKGLPAVELAVVTRPDARDRVLAALMPLQHKLGKDARRQFLETVHATVQSGPVEGDKTWPLLQKAISVIRKKHRHPRLDHIEAACRRGSAGAQVAPGGHVGTKERARTAFRQAVTLMDRVRKNSHRPEAASEIGQARKLLEGAVRVAREKKMPDLFDMLVSWGNAWKTSPDKDLEKALERYDQAEQLGGTRDQLGKLSRVWAEALLARGQPDDIRQAEKQIDRSLAIRQTWRVESFLTAAQIARVHPDLEEAEQCRRAAGHLMNAVRADRNHAKQALDFLLNCLATWQRLRPGDASPEQFREELRTLYPTLREKVDAPVRNPPEREVKLMLKLMRNPAIKAYMKMRTRLATAAERSLDAHGLLERIEPEVRARMEETAARESLLDRPDECEAVLARLEHQRDPATRPGVLTARAVLLAHLVRAGRRTVEEARRAARAALDAVSNLKDRQVRVALMRELASTWSPADHAGDPVRDFAFAADVLRNCVALEGGESQATDDNLRFLARALRYSPEGDPEANLRESHRLYGLVVGRARAAGDPDTLANAIHNLAEAEAQMGEGPRLDRLLREAQQVEEAFQMARSPFKKAEYLSNLAFIRTQIGNEMGGAEGRAWLERAMATFDQVDVSKLNGGARRNMEVNRAVCEGSLRRIGAGRNAEIAHWRQQLSKLDEGADPVRAATAKHNLANALMFGDRLKPEELAEGLRFSRAAATVRANESNRRHSWETAFNAGTALLAQLLAGGAGLPMPPREAWEEARQWLREAIAAARTLGPGAELARSAFALCALAMSAQRTSEAIDLAEEGWKGVQEASGFLLLDLESREQEAATALAIAVALARRLSGEALAIDTPGLAFVLQGDSAEIVRRWLLRSQYPARRPLRARIARPRGVPARLWEEWRDALQHRNQRRVAGLLHQLHEVAPDFLADAEHDQATWDWLRSRPGSVALALHLDPTMALVMRVEGSRQRSWILGLEPEEETPALEPEAMAEIMRAGGAPARALQEELSTWVRRNALGPVLRFLGERPTAILWSPGAGLRLIAPNALWGEVPVAMAATLALTDHQDAPARRRSTLVALADPGERGGQWKLDSLGEKGLGALRRLAKTASARGPVWVLGSAAERHGRALLGMELGANVRDTPASATDLLSEVATHDVVVVIAHGVADTLEDAALVCVGAEGTPQKLGIELLGAQPDRFEGATVLLLSCETGRVGESLAQPGGIAGTLISAGARAVVSPLWKVDLEVAAQVGEAVLDGLVEGRRPWEVLAGFQLRDAAPGPALGGPPPAAAERRADELLQRQAFVTWVG